MVSDKEQCVEFTMHSVYNNNNRWKKQEMKSVLFDSAKQTDFFPHSSVHQYHTDSNELKLVLVEKKDLTCLVPTWDS